MHTGVLVHSLVGPGAGLVGSLGLECDEVLPGPGKSVRGL